MHDKLDYILFTAAMVLLFAAIEVFRQYRIRTIERQERVPWENDLPARLVPWLMASLVVGLLVLGWFVAAGWERRIKEETRSLYGSIAPNLAYDLQKMGHFRLTPSTPPDDPAYLAIIGRMQHWMKSNPYIRRIYTVRKRADGAPVVIAAPEADIDRDGRIATGEEQRIAPGTPLGTALRGLDEAFGGKQAFHFRRLAPSGAIVQLVPLFDPSGKQEGVLAVEYRNEIVSDRMRGARLNVIGFLSITFLVLFAAYVAGFRARQEGAILRHHQAELLERERMMNAIMDAALDALIIVDAQGVVTSWNPAAERMFGYGCEEAVGKGLHRLIIPDHLFKAHQEPFKQFAATGQGSLVGRVTESVGKSKEGRTFPAELSLSAFRFNDQWMAAGIVRDITGRKTIEEELKRATQAAERANRAKSEFLSRMSHELRTPLNAVLGFSQLLESDRDEPLSGRQRESVSEILTAGRHLLDLINEMLDLSRIETGNMKLSLEPVRLVQVVEECRALMAREAAKRGVRISSEARAGDVATVADKVRLRQVLLNLVSNAVKYNRQGGTVLIGTEKREPGMVAVSVTDEGAGIPDDKLRHLFEPFNRLGAEGGEVEGIGIGLAITRGLVELMNGSIEVESRSGAGCRFTILLPEGETTAESGADGEEKSAAEEPSGGTRRTILYVEDNPSNRKLMGKIAERLPDTELIMAPDAFVGIALAKSRRPDVILMDIHLPGMSGLEALVQLREIPETSRIPVIAVTAHAMPADVEKGIAAGFVNYLTKPITLSDLTEALQGAAPDPAGSTSPAVSIEETMPHTLLCIDDDPITRILLERIVDRRGNVATRCAAAGEEGIALAQALRPQLIITDITLPDMDGYEVLRRLREDPATGSIPVVALSGHCAEEDRKRGLAAGFSAYLDKPLGVNSFHLLLDYYFPPTGDDPSA